MLFQGRYEKQIKRVKEMNEGSKRAVDEEGLQNQLEKGDITAMILSALIIIVPIALVFLVAVSLAGYFFIMR